MNNEQIRAAHEEAKRVVAENGREYFRNGNHSFCEPAPRLSQVEIDKNKFTRTIFRTVESNKPKWTASPATAVLEFVIVPNGTVENLHITQSSGIQSLDDQLIAAIRRGKYVKPPETATLQDRTFEVTFRYN